MVQQTKLAAVGLEMGLAVAIGIGMGYWLDDHFSTQPILLIVFLLFGVAAGFKGIIRASREAQRAQQDAQKASKEAEKES